MGQVVASNGTTAEHHGHVISASIFEAVFLVVLRRLGAPSDNAGDSGPDPVTAIAVEAAVGSGVSSPASATASELHVGFLPESCVAVPAAAFSPWVAASSSSCRPP